MARKAGGLQRAPQGRGQGGDAVGALDGHRAEGARAGRRGQRRGRRPERGVVRIGGPGQQCLAAALHVQRQLTVDQDDERARLAARLVPGPVRRLRPGQGGPVRVGRVGRCEDQGTGVGARLRTVPGGGDGAEPVDRAVHRELRRPQSLHDVAPARLSVVLEDRQHPVRRREPALDALRLDGAPGHHAVPVQQRAGQGVGAVRGLGFDGRKQGPAARDRGRPGA